VTIHKKLMEFIKRSTKGRYQPSEQMIRMFGSSLESGGTIMIKCKRKISISVLKRK